MYIVQELGVFAIETLLTQLYVSIDILLTWRTLAWPHYVSKRGGLDIYN
jgi:hypothetical protein